MEEILASIRRIIADDQALFASSEGAPPEALRLAPDPRSPMAEFAEAAEATDGLSPERVQEPLAEAFLGSASPRAATDAEAEPPLVSAATDGSVFAAFNALVASRFVQSSDVVTALTRELLRPMLTAWLDANLPAMVERLVRAEIERVARGD